MMSAIADNKKTGGPFGEGPSSSFPVTKGQLATWLVMTGVTMLFCGLFSSYIVLRGSPDWQKVALPTPLLWVNTLVLVASSITLEIARRMVKQDRQRDLMVWLTLSGILGLAFLGGQLLAWRQLVHAGVYLPSTLHSSFFYVLTGIHGVHLAGGLIALGYAFRKGLTGALRPSAHEPLKLSALYWHFMDAVWIFVFLLLTLV